MLCGVMRGTPLMAVPTPLRRLRHESDGNNGDEPRQPAGGGRGRTGAATMVAVARCFRDLPLCTPQAVAAAAALEELRAAGTMEDAAALGAVLAAWSGAAEGERGGSDRD